MTTAANVLISPIHERMPVIIDKADYSDWLDKQTASAITQQLLTHPAYQNIILKPVSDWVNNPQHNDKNCLN